MEYYLMESVIEDINGMEKSLFEISTPRLEWNRNYKEH